MRAPPATNNELFGVLGLAAFVAAAILYWQTPKPQQEQQPQPQQPQVVVQVQKQEVKPARWELGGVGPGWASGRWLGEGDFVHQGYTEHPFRHQPPHSGHPLPSLPTQGRQGYEAPSYRP
jgi:hypothetical protein